jgi:hypothetical protein
MSSMTAVGGASTSWPGFASARASSTKANAMKDQMFAKVGNDGSSSVDTTGPQRMPDYTTPGGLPAPAAAPMTAPSSTLRFAQQRSADEDDGDDGDDAVSPQEQAGGELKDMMNQLVSSMDTNGDNNISKDEVEQFKSDFSAFVDQVVKQYSQASATGMASNDDTSGLLAMA